ncbi:hypothetical protein [Bradyrhizobium elkanii]|uniref:Beta-lactam-binding protein with PASTA domain n=1 Tax=Bradyrhizobium elkanii TaxID=29448 RepID=A0ABV4FAH0_BRAEL|nr:hypothetical protein [Bradyrhizobium elkanii]MCP1752036.1 beta-lactam-binding protein with PASTA domain [Bradyrhizobium elkanii]MCP1977807.1 beta-lactam-binding protein with PASTA domain [Bradyrhizobium elkanii]MCS3887675.1 beta-lactam-binding protein with PASTA domain [Bradyrhizobium elkanii]MCS4213306.1 beta-lactam-binding protein with PASTA domain [Bradyrhizobium elkanii]MCW2213612.1 beta-lactam-binding protein with PASTA domain [Bradyrhizobium elkanii]
MTSSITDGRFVVDVTGLNLTDAQLHELDQAIQKTVEQHLAKSSVGHIAGQNPGAPRGRVYSVLAEK